MSFYSKTLLYGDETQVSRLRETAMPILVGGAAGVGTGALIWIMAVIRFGIPGWFWP